MASNHYEFIIETVEGILNAVHNHSKIYITAPVRVSILDKSQTPLNPDLGVDFDHMISIENKCRIYIKVNKCEYPPHNFDIVDVYCNDGYNPAPAIFILNSWAKEEALLESEMLKEEGNARLKRILWLYDVVRDERHEGFWLERR